MLFNDSTLCTISKFGNIHPLISDPKNKCVAKLVEFLAVELVYTKNRLIFNMMIKIKINHHKVDTEN